MSNLNAVSNLTSFLLIQRDDGVDEDDDDEEEEEEEEEKKDRQAPPGAAIQGQVHVNVSPPAVGRAAIGAAPGSRRRSRSYDRNLDESPPPRRLGALERMLSCPVRLSEGAGTATAPAPPRVTSFAEIARSKRRNGGSGGSPPLKTTGDPFFSSAYSAHSSSLDFSPIAERRPEANCRSLSPVPFTRCYSQGSAERHLQGAREPRTKAEGTSPPTLTATLALSQNINVSYFICSTLVSTDSQGQTTLFILFSHLNLY